jgi:hypothetical protein
LPKQAVSRWTSRASGPGAMATASALPDTTPEERAQAAAMRTGESLPHMIVYVHARTQAFIDMH